MAPTLTDVAKRADVALSTASRAFSDPQRLGPDTLRKVLDAAQAWPRTGEEVPLFPVEHRGGGVRRGRQHGRLTERADGGGQLLGVDRRGGPGGLVERPHGGDLLGWTEADL